jgi:cytoskeletal protein CcmA (bactofilin family)
MEYAAAKSSLCRQCGRYFSPFAPKSGLKPRTKEDSPPASASPSFFQKFDDFWKRQRSSVVECFECKRKQEVSGAATSTICPSCSAHIDLRDYKISSGFSRTIRTCGNVHLTAKGDLSSSSVICKEALIEGRLRANLHCIGTATVSYAGRIPGRISAGHLIVERKADVHCFRRVRAGSIEIKGKMSGEIVAETIVTIRKKGSLEGNVTAKAFTVEKGGMFSGQLIIGQSGLTQGELLAEQKPIGVSKTQDDATVITPQPVPAT